ncbi:MAG: hypothetical protein ACMZ66_13015 [Thalassospira sp.]|uniref:hypothetical protein n=1 Tax=Thalassospira sp. TaxID=1912094 RepID=UPI003A8742FC
MNQLIPFDRPVLITDDTMHPRYDVGSYVVTTKSRRPKIGSRVLITYTNGTKTIREVASIERDTIKLKQYNPIETEMVGITKISDISVIDYSFEK